MVQNQQQAPQEELDENGQPVSRRRGFSIWDWMPSFGLGTMLTLAVILIGGYFLAKSDSGKEFLNDLVGNLSPEWQAKIGGFLQMIGLDGIASGAMYDYAESMTAQQAREQMDGKVPAEVANILAADDATWRRVVGHLREAQANMLDPISDRTIYQLMTREPQMVQQILRAMPRDGGNAESREKIMGAVRGIVSNPQMLGTLLSTEHRANTFAALEALSPIPFQPGRLQRFIETTGMQNGQPTPQLTSLMNAMLGSDTAAMTQGLAEFLRGTRAQDIHQLFQGVNPASVPEGMLRDVVVTAKHEGNLQAMLTLSNALGQEKLTQLSTLIGAGNQAELLRTLQADPAMMQALTSFARSTEISQLPPAWQQPVQLLRGGSTTIEAVNALGTDNIQRWQQTIAGPNGNLPADQQASNFALMMLNTDERQTMLNNRGLMHIGRMMQAQAREATGDERALYQFLGTTVQRNGREVFANIATLYTFTDAVAKNPDNFGSPARATATNKVVDGLVRYLVSHDAAALRDVNATDFSNFFRSPRNHAAFSMLLNRLDTRALEPQHRALIQSLKTHWGNTQDGIAEVLADPETAGLFLNLLKNPQAMSDAMRHASSSGVLADTAKAVWWSSWNPWGATDKMSENRGHLEAVANALRNAGVGEATANSSPAQDTTPHAGIPGSGRLWVK